MTIKVGDKVPSVTLRYVTPDGVKAVTTDEFFAGKKVVLFGLPGAYTRTCSERHLPGYVTHASELKAKGVDTVACLAANDHFEITAADSSAVLLELNHQVMRPLGPPGASGTMVLSKKDVRPEAGGNTQP